jgi:DNA-directed RNA polymerase
MTPDPTKISLRASRNAIAANTVHSHDAALMHRVITKNKWQVIQTLHDCYCISPSDCGEFVKILPNEIKCIFGVDMPERLLYAAS